MLSNYYFLNESFAYGGLTVSSLKSDSMNEENIFLAADMCNLITTFFFQISNHNFISIHRY